MTPEQRQEIEVQIQNDFAELQKKLVALKAEIQNETDEAKKQEKNEEIKILESEAEELKTKIDTLKSLNEQDLESLKTRLESFKTAIQNFKGEVVDLQNEKFPTPTTYELLKNSATIKGIEGDSEHPGLLKIIESNPNEFKNLPGATAEKKLEYIFTKIRTSIVLFMRNKLGGSDKYNKIITQTITPALERSLLELLRDQGNEANVGMLKGIDKISRESFGKLVRGVSKFAGKAAGSYNKFNQWMNAIDYLSVHNGALRNPEKSAVLTDPLKFKAYLNNNEFLKPGFSPYSLINGNLFELSEDENFEFGVSLQEKQKVLQEIGNIKVVNSPKTTALIAGMLDKPEQFLQKTQGLQETANGLLESVNSLNSVTKMFGVDILGEITKAPEKRSFLYRIMDFVCKLIGITGGLEGIVKRWRMDRMNLTDAKNENISQIFEGYKEGAGENEKLTITDENTCKTALEKFAVTKNQPSTTKGDFLRDSIIDKMDVSLVSPAIVQQILGDSYIKKETFRENGRTQERYVVDASKITESDKMTLAHSHLINMKAHLEVYKDDQRGIDLSDFYQNINSTEDIALCITASLYANAEDVIEGVKAKVFLPENYGAVRMDGTVVEQPTSSGRENLDSVESSDKQIVTEQWVYDKAIEYGITDNRQIAYVLSTIKGESGFKNQKEIGGENRDYGKVDSSTGKAYYGRGFIQITHKYNYEKYTQIIRESGKDFKDNNGNTLKGSEIDLVNNPDIILQSNDLAIFIAMDWMKNGGPSRQNTKRLDYYINDNKQDYYNARIIINGMSSKPQEYANNAQTYLDKLGKGSLNSPIESNELLIGPRLLAHNKDEIGGLGNSIMNGFQGGNGKSDFPNMDGIVGKNTRNHPHRFLSKNDVSSYKTTHPDIKSFMFYFGANNSNNQQTISDIIQWSAWLKESGIQPVLCTNIGADIEKTSHLQELNEKILKLGNDEKIPVIDFASAYKKGDISLSSDGLHPKSYSSMTNIVNSLLS